MRLKKPWRRRPLQKKQRGHESGKAKSLRCVRRENQAGTWVPAVGCGESQSSRYLQKRVLFSEIYPERSKTMQLDNIRFSFGRAIRRELPSILSTAIGAALLGITVFFALVFA